VNRIKQGLSILISCLLVLGGAPRGYAQQEEQDTSPPVVQPAQLTQPQLEQLVAPIALYPDALIAQILAAATYPEEVVQADRWMEAHRDLQGENLAKQVDRQPWDPSVKALTQFPSVLANLDKNLAWTSSLGDAYVNHQEDVMGSIQIMRQRAQKAGNLNSTPQQAVSTQGSNIMIEPVDPDVIYVPQYDPWAVYGGPVDIWPGWYWYPGLFLPGPGISFGLGFGVGFYGGFGWGWHNWGFDWGHRSIIHNHNTYITHSRTFINRGILNRGGDRAFRGFSQPRFSAPHEAAPRSHAFGGFDHGGISRGYSSRGRSSFGGGFHAGGGGFHGGGGGGFHGGGGRR
jgi:hypothetical protein